MKESKEELQLTVKKTIHEMNGFASPPKIQSIHLNVFAFHLHWAAPAQ